jgi:hypothetical protein
LKTFTQYQGLYTFAGNQNTSGTPELAVPWFSTLVGGLKYQMPAFAPGLFQVKTLVKKSVTGTGFSVSSAVSPVNFIPPLLHTDSYITTICRIVLRISSIVKYSAIKGLGLSYRI